MKRRIYQHVSNTTLDEGKNVQSIVYRNLEIFYHSEKVFPFSNHQG